MSKRKRKKSRSARRRKDSSKLARPLTDDEARALIDYLLHKAIDACTQTRTSIPDELPSTPDSPQIDNEKPA